jgi:hypothetical protein
VVRSIHSARADFERGNLASARGAIQAALDQVPSSPVVRALAREISEAIEVERTSAENQRMVAELVTEGRRLYRAGSYVESKEIFGQALELDPQNEIAASYFELSEERIQRARARQATASRTTQKTGGTQAAAVAPPTPTPEPGIARVTLSFDSPISTGLVVITLDGESLAEVPFDFSSKGMLGFKLGSKTFTKTLDPESRWTLRIDLPDKRSEPGFFLVQSAR